MQVRFSYAPGGVEARVRPAALFQGFSGVLHGGMVAGLLDDAMWWAVYAVHNVVTLTAEIQVRYRQPVPVETELQLQAQVQAARGARLFVTEGRILGPNGQVLAEANGKFMAAPPEMAAALIRDMA